jgi:hypothetical protein
MIPLVSHLTETMKMHCGSTSQPNVDGHMAYLMTQPVVKLQFHPQIKNEKGAALKLPSPDEVVDFPSPGEGRLPLNR